MIAESSLMSDLNRPFSFGFPKAFRAAAPACLVNERRWANRSAVASVASIASERRWCAPWSLDGKSSFLMFPAIFLFGKRSDGSDAVSAVSSVDFEGIILCRRFSRLRGFFHVCRSRHSCPAMRFGLALLLWIHYCLALNVALLDYSHRLKYNWSEATVFSLSICRHGLLKHPRRHRTSSHRNLPLDRSSSDVSAHLDRTLVDGSHRHHGTWISPGDASLADQAPGASCRIVMPRGRVGASDPSLVQA